MSRFLSNLVQALDALRVHRRRSLLSILGITIGITAVMAVGTISRGGNHLIYRELETFGLNSVWVYRNWNTQDTKLRERHGSGIQNEDFHLLLALAETLLALLMIVCWLVGFLISTISTPGKQ